jgi:hypothetical protein
MGMKHFLLAGFNNWKHLQEVDFIQQFVIKIAKRNNRVYKWLCDN